MHTLIEKYSRLENVFEVAACPDRTAIITGNAWKKPSIAVAAALLLGRDKAIIKQLIERWPPRLRKASDYDVEEFRKFVLSLDDPHLVPEQFRA